MENSSIDDAPGAERLKVDPGALKDIRFGAETLRTTLKEKYLGRMAGAKRGETNVSYGAQKVLSLIIGIAMMTLLAGMYRMIS